MEMFNLVMQAITAVGFPIVACVALFIQMEKQDTRHDEEVKKITESLNNNTIAITKLSERLTTN